MSKIMRASSPPLTSPVVSSTSKTEAMSDTHPSTSEPKTPRSNRTAYIDGIRGLAAFLVYWHHYQTWVHEQEFDEGVMSSGFGYEGNYYFCLLPGVRLLFVGGPPAVAMFFFISGYVLSTKPLNLIHSGELMRLSDNLASALFRRMIRLWLPVAATTFIFLVTWHIFGLYTPLIKPESNIFAEIYRWYLCIVRFSFVYKTDANWFNYNFHLWSIATESQGSVIIYTSLFAFSRCRQGVRLLGWLVLIVYFLLMVDGAHFAMFLAGMLLNDIDLLTLRNDLPYILTRFFRLVEPFKELVLVQMFVCGIYLAGVPSYMPEPHPKYDIDLQLLRQSPGWYYLSYLCPSNITEVKLFYLFWAGLFLMISIPRISWFRAFFETPFTQYLGRISYSLYLIHGPVLWTIGDRLYAAVGYLRESHILRIPGWMSVFPLSRVGPLGLEFAFLLPQLICLPVTLTLAEVSTKFFDEKSVVVAQQLYAWVTA